MFLDFGPSSPITPHVPSVSARLLLTGLLFAGTGSLVALSPIGRRSGAHLNPAVTLAFWTQGKVHPHDLVGYVTAQTLGPATAAAAAAAGLRLAWGHTAVALTSGRDRTWPRVQSPGGRRPGNAQDCCPHPDDLLHDLQRRHRAVESPGQLATGRFAGLAGRPLLGHQPQPGTQRRTCATGPRAEASVGSTSPDRSARDAGCGCVCRVSQYDHADRQALPRPALPRYVGRSASDRGFRGRVHLTSGVVVQPRRHTPGT